MAQQVSNSPEARRHYAAQAALVAALSGALSRVRLSPLSGRYGQVLAALVQDFSYGSISVAADYFTEARDVAGVAKPFSPTLTEPWSLGSVEAYIHTSLDEYAKELDGALTEAAAKVQAEGVAKTLTLDAGRHQLLTSAAADPVRPRWARVARPDACSFCLMLATRGAVYRTESTAEFRAHMPFNGRGGVCHCSIEMVFDARDYEPPDYIAEKKSLWAETSIPGDPKESRRAFRRAVDAERRA